MAHPHTTAKPLKEEPVNESGNAWEMIVTGADAPEDGWKHTQGCMRQSPISMHGEAMIDIKKVGSSDKKMGLPNYARGPVAIEREAPTLLNLPGEVRSRILTEVLSAVNPLSPNKDIEYLPSVKSQNTRWQSTAPNKRQLHVEILGTCKQLYQESRAVLYKSNTVRVFVALDTTNFIHIFALGAVLCIRPEGYSSRGADDPERRRLDHIVAQLFQFRGLEICPRISPTKRGLSSSSIAKSIGRFCVWLNFFFSTGLVVKVVLDLSHCQPGPRSADDLDWSQLACLRTWAMLRHPQLDVRGVTSEARQKFRQAVQGADEPNDLAARAEYIDESVMEPLMNVLSEPVHNSLEQAIDRAVANYDVEEFDRITQVDVPNEVNLIIQSLIARSQQCSSAWAEGF